MRETVKLPSLGENMTAAVVVERHPESGSHVSAGDVLLTVEADKVDVDVPSPVAGELVEWLVEPEDEIEVGGPICVVEI